MDNDKSYFIFQNGEKRGPLPAETVRDMARKGSLSESDHIWCAGMEGWTSAVEIVSGQTGSAHGEKLLPATVTADTGGLADGDAEERDDFEPMLDRPHGQTAMLPAPAGNHDESLVRCPSCGSSQFFGRRKVTPIGWILYFSAIVNIPISFLLTFILIGWVTLFATPVLAIIGFYGCRTHVNTCARCKREF